MRADLGCRLALVMLLAWFCFPLRSRADSPVFSLSALYESPTIARAPEGAHRHLALPVAILVFPSDGSTFKLAQIGWTSSAEAMVRLSPKLYWVLDASVTPRFAHSGNRVYRAGEQVDALAFRATALQGTTGLRLVHSPHVLSDLRVGVLKEWVSQLAPATLEMWRRPYEFVQLGMSLSFVRSDDRYRMRWDGTKAEASVQGFYGENPFARGQASLGVGRKLGPLFVQLQGAGSYITSHNLVARALVGGSWDVLGAQAIHGHPYAEFRARQSATGTARLDLALGRVLELGVRASAGQMDGAFHHGAAAMLSMLAGGVFFYVGVATPDAQLERTLAFAGLIAATFL